MLFPIGLARLFGAESLDDQGKVSVYSETVHESLELVREVFNQGVGIPSMIGSQMRILKNQWLDLKKNQIFESYFPKYYDSAFHFQVASLTFCFMAVKNLEDDNSAAEEEMGFTLEEIQSHFERVDPKYIVILEKHIEDHFKRKVSIQFTEDGFLDPGENSTPERIAIIIAGNTMLFTAFTEFGIKRFQHAVRGENSKP